MWLEGGKKRSMLKEKKKPPPETIVEKMWVVSGKNGIYVMKDSVGSMIYI